MKKAISYFLSIIMILSFLPTYTISVNASSKLANPTNIKVENGYLSWDSVENADSYEIRICNEGSTSTIVGYESKQTSLTIKDCFNSNNQLTAGNTYYFRIRAVDSTNTYLKSNYENSNAFIFYDSWTVTTSLLDNNGVVFPSTPTAVENGNNLQITIIPNAGYVVDEVRINGIKVAPQNNTYLITNITANKQVSVSFKPCVHNWVLTQSQKPSCTEEGYNKYTCSICNSAKTDTVAKLAHTLTIYSKDVPATCVTDGKTASYVCNDCGYTQESKVIPKTGRHDIDDGIITKNSTCAQEGEKTYKCKVCNDVIHTESVETLPHHSDSGTEIKPATCKETGIKEYRCKDCNQVVRTVTLDEVFCKSDDGTITQAPTCTEQGTKIYKCVFCDSILNTETLNATGHTYTSKVVKPTYKAGGYTLYTCACGNSYKDKATKKLNLKTPAVTTKVSKKNLKISYKKITGATKYEIQYSKDKNFKKGNKTFKQSATSKTIKNLKKGTYYVRVRAYNKDAKSSWSAKKTVKIK